MCGRDDGAGAKGDAGVGEGRLMASPEWPRVGSRAVDIGRAERQAQG